MRYLLLLLILANLGLLAWTQWVEPGVENRPTGRAGESLGAGLELASERPGVTVAKRTDDEAAVAEPVVEPATEARGIESEGDSGTDEGPQADAKDVASPVAESVAEPAYRCVSLGPFDALDAAEVAVTRLADRGFDAHIREAGGQIRSGYWVYLPPHESRSDAKEIEAELREKGVRDLFIVTGAENRNAISLGLFSTPDRADQRAAEIGRLGFSPQIAERFRDATVYWLDYRELPGDRLEPQSIGVLGADGVIPEKRHRDCAAEDFRQG